ncbi:Mucin-associated surface protein (MASP) [Trypanosoma cruzi]|uniref:Mucin-associated surface protein (MASP), putative n=2 Tax=Trypanosoma cruzi TaxID=5693 RepID=Q4E453_TRYCC|nr:mucin-associated surface protein (MASP), putative [Trypanosoma cruzi]EAN99569.1 mucin-associated surface protein (MASP), putative [Trypanosoma cruzi]PWV21284.1 Mucin-associated surface protein (MASP) [Trypanosoma cruzi]RNC43847.1 mucin-associated surface protein (MASP) [Trypanosoma cruzi]|eukprot:XP_821420.1 mucin-associated surface protein (MASP) [Trypanosoma cruzi strain CL Brener]
MAMMTGRVLLVCALCVLWCGAGCGRCEEEGTAVPESDADLPLASKQLENSPQDTQGLNGGVPGANVNVPPASPEPREGEDDVDDDDSEETEAQEEIIEGQSGQGGTAAIGSDSMEENLIGSEKKTGQSIVPAKDIPHSGSQESNANPTQKEIEKKDSGKNTPAVGNALTTRNGENTLPAEGNPPSSPKSSDDSRKQDGEDTTSEEEENVPPPETAATPQSHRDKGTEGTVEDTKATTVTANTRDTTSTQNSDGSTAVSHTTSPLLLLLLVSCAAAAAVVAA